MHILYLHPSGAHGGASISLIELFKAMRQSGLRGTVLTPEGSAAKAFFDNGMEVVTVRGLSQFDNTRYGHYRRIRWVILLRELFFLPGSLRGLWRLRKTQFDVLHVNEITLLPLAVVAKKLKKIPMVVHVRSLQCPHPDSLRTRIINRLLAKYANAVVPIDQTVANTLDRDICVKVIHNGLCVDINQLSEKKIPRSLNSPILVGFVGALVAHKGIYELIEAMRILKSRGVAIECIVAGNEIRDLSGVGAWAICTLGLARQVRRDLERMIRDYDLEKSVRLVGFVADLNELYSKLDILCFPTHLDAAGRPVFEAAYYSVPSVVAIKTPYQDAIIHEYTGLAIPRSDPDLIANALERLAKDQQLRLALGRRAQSWAIKTFSIRSSAQSLLDIYQRLEGVST